MLTPIRVRGKNRRDQSGRSLCKFTKLGSREATAAASTTPGKAKPGRPLKLPPLLVDDDSVTSKSCKSSPSSSRLNSPSASSINFSSRTKPALKARRRRRSSRVSQLSLLERLPTELLQSIFVLSDNLQLPLASPILAQLLSSRHVYTALCSRAFPAHTDEHDDPDLQSALLRQPWFTLEFLEAMTQRRGLSRGAGFPELRFQSARVPARLVSAPWTEEKMEMLEKLLAYNAQVDWFNTTTGEEAEQGLRDAILEGCIRAVRLLLREDVGVTVSTELLKLAVFQGGCKRDIVSCLISQGMAYEKVSRPGRVDWEDAELWHFALQHGETEVGSTYDDGDDGRDGNSGRGWLADLLEKGIDAYSQGSRRYRHIEAYCGDDDSAGEYIDPPSD
ncbi:MAG: hypothetical protein M1839_004078 [Geoglossum umbratile]|nr:MAG: hypothetical protein M1839_004078 [Geoglossum umbratile]